MSNQPFDIRSLRKAESEKYTKIKEKEDAEKIKLQLEQDEKLLKELIVVEQLENLLNSLDICINKALTGENIKQLQTALTEFEENIEQNKKYLDDDHSKNQISSRILMMINTISDNPNSKFNIADKDEKECSQSITQITKSLLSLINLSDQDINFELMDTSNDVDVAKKLQEELNLSPNDDLDLSDIDNTHAIEEPDFTFEPDIESANVNMDMNMATEIPVKTINTDYFVGFDQIEDPELIQLSYYQEEFLDQ